jgi:hypothetical protein
MRTIVKILSALGIVVHGVFVFACFAASGLSDGPPESVSAWIPLLLPFIYYGYCLITSSHSFSGPFLLFTGILAHLIMLVFCFHAVRKGAGILVIEPLILAPCWFYMCLQRRERPK